MKNIPDSTENVIVAVIYQEKFSWYVSEKEIWFLDYQKRLVAFENKGYKVNLEYIDESRQNLLVVDSNNVPKFLNRIKDDKVNTQELKKLLFEKETDSTDNWQYDYRPSLYVNFDKKIFYSNYSEPASYEEYVPKLWKSKYKDFIDEIPLEERYWIDENGKNMLENI